MRTTGLVASVLALALLTSCGPTPEPTAGPVPATSTSPSAPVGTETEGASDPAAITRILLRTENVYFGDELGWGVDGFRFQDDPVQVVAKLTAVFGAEPETTDYGDDGLLARDHDWGGFRLYYSLTPTGALEGLGMGVRVTAASVNDITVETVDGVAVGQRMRDAAALASETFTWGDELFEARFDIVSDGPADRFIAAFGAADRSGPVTELTGPISGGSL
jgi:hypothetical protein